MTATAKVTPIAEINPYFQPALNKGLNRCKPGRKIKRKISKIGRRKIAIGTTIRPRIFQIILTLSSFFSFDKEIMKLKYVRVTMKIF